MGWRPDEVVRGRDILLRSSIYPLVMPDCAVAGAGRTFITLRRAAWTALESVEAPALGRSYAWL